MTSHRSQEANPVMLTVLRADWPLGLLGIQDVTQVSGGRLTRWNPDLIVLSLESSAHLHHQKQQQQQSCGGDCSLRQWRRRRVVLCHCLAVVFVRCSVSSHSRCLCLLV